MSVEIRSVNHRFVDVRTRVPSAWSELGWRLEQLARKRLARGRHEVAVRVRLDEASSSVVDATRVRRVYAALRALGEELEPGSGVPWEAVLQAPDIFVTGHALDTNLLLAAMKDAFGAAASDADKMRRQEGDAIESDLRARMEGMLQMLEQIAELAEHNVGARRELLHGRLDSVLSDVAGRTFDEQRLEQEVALLADRLDVSEELTRLRSHFTQWDTLCAEEGPVGRKLDFLVQEIFRELNTIGSKCQNAKMVHTVVEMKAELERIREQVQNVE